MNYKNFEELLKKNNTTAYRLAKDIGISSSSFSDWKHNRSAPKADKLMVIAKYFGISIDELLGLIDDKCNVSTAVSKNLTRAVIPVIGEIRADKPITAKENIIGTVYADKDSLRGSADDYFYLKIHGDSMMNCGMIDGSLVLFSQRHQRINDGTIVACLTGSGGVTVKRYFRRRQKIYLMPDNCEYEPIILNIEDFETGAIRIIGVAVEIKIIL